MPPEKDVFSQFVSKYCRMCALELKQGVFIFGDEGKRLQISEKIRKTLSILVLEEDSLPKKICMECCSSLEDYAQYKDTVLDAQDKLATIARNLERVREIPPRSIIIEQSSQHVSSILEKALISPPRSKAAADEEVYSEKNNSIECEMAEEPPDLCDSGSLSPSPSKSLEDTLKLPTSPEKASQEDEGILQCGICGDPAEDRDTLKKHHKDNHDDLERYPSPVYGCSFCPRISENYNALRMHIYRHLKEGTFKCEQCTKTFPVKDQLAKHMNNTHNATGKGTFSCKICGKRFKVKYTLHLHMTSKHPLQQEEEEDSRLMETEQPLETVTSEIPSSPIHMEDNHQEDEEDQEIIPITVNIVPPDKSPDKKSPSEDLGVWKCGYCDKQYETQRGYELHIAIHIGKRHICEHCDKAFTQKSSLLHHVTSQHSALSGQHKCSICSKEFSTLKLLNRHERRHTEPEVESKCSICGKVFRTLLHLKSHLKGHKSKKNYICTTCGKRFMNQHKLSIHENTHTGARTLKCAQCPYAARTEGPLYKHIKKHHHTKEKQATTSTAVSATVTSNSLPKSNSSSNHEHYENVPILEDLSLKSPQKQQIQLHTVTVTLPSHFNSSSCGNNSSFTQISEHSTSTENQIMNAHSSSQNPNLHHHNSHQPSWNVSSNNFHNNSSNNCTSLDLVDCAIQHAFNNEGVSYQSSSHNYTPSHAHSSTTLHSNSSPSNAHSTAPTFVSSASIASSNNGTILSGNSSRASHHHNNISSPQHEPMQLSYKLQIESNDMPMELTKVFQRDPLELCVRQEFNQLMDLSARVNGNNMDGMSAPLSINNNTISCVGLGNYHKELSERELSFNDLSGAFRQPIDLIAREDASHEICSEGNLVDLSLRSSFVQEDQSTFLRELIDLSSRPDSFHGELNLTNKQSHSNHQQSPNKGQHQHGSLVIYNDAMFTL